MSKQDNLTDFLTDVANAIREQKGTTEKINPQKFSDEIKSLKKSPWTGHADVEGLKAIGWDDEDIAYYQEHGVNWMAEDDEYHKVSDDNKDLYGVLTADNIANYKDRIVWLPKIDTSGKTSMSNFFKDCENMVGMPLIDTKENKYMKNMFRNCCSLTCIPPIDTSNVISIAYAFVACYQLLHVPRLNTSQVTSAENAFNSCYSIRDVGTLDLTNLSTGDAMFYLCYSIERINLIGCSIANMNNLVQGCGNLKVVYGLDISQAETYNSFIGACSTLTEVRLKGLHFSLNIESRLLSKRSILYLIENEVAIEPIIITLARIKYNKYANDPEVLEALSNHPLITLASA